MRFFVRRAFEQAHFHIQQKGRSSMKPVKKRGSSPSGGGFKAVSIILSLLIAAAGGYAIFQLLTLGAFPAQITYGVCAIIVVLAILVISMQFFLTKRTAGKIACSILSVAVAAVMSLGAFYVSKATSLISNVTTIDSTSQNLVEAIALKTSSLSDEKSLEGQKVGILKTVARASTDDLLNVLSSNNIHPQTQEYDGILDLTTALYDKEVEAIILPAAYRGQIADLDNERFKNFYDDTKVVFSATFAKQSSNTTVPVNDVTTTPFNVLISGTDSRNGFGEVARSDVNMIATVNPKTHVVLLTSIPRDYYVETACEPDAGCANGQLDKLTHTGLHGTETTKATLEKLLGIEINYTMKVNFSSVINLVDALGGIDVTVEPGYAVASFYTDPRYGVSEGVNHLNGDQALAFARERYAYSEGDRQRVRNQQQVLMAVAKKAMSPSIITSYPSLMDALAGAFQTDMSEDEIKALIQNQISSNPSWDFLTYSLDGSGATEYCAELGNSAYVMIPNYETVATAKDRIEGVIEGKSATEIDETYGKAEDVENQTENRPAQDTQPDQSDDTPTDPGTSDPGYIEPVDPGTSDPGYIEPTDPGTSNPGYVEPINPGPSDNGQTPVDPGTGDQDPGLPAPPVEEETPGTPA